MRKYRNRPTAGYASKGEHRRAQELRMLARSGAISGLREQVRYELIPAQRVDGKVVERATHYVADFVYMEGGREVVEDYKGYRTDAYRIKRKLMLWVHGVRIRETGGK